MFSLLYGRCTEFPGRVCIYVRNCRLLHVQPKGCRKNSAIHTEVCIPQKLESKRSCCHWHTGAKGIMPEIISILEKWSEGNELEIRAVVAALCEPKLLKNKEDVRRILQILIKITLTFENVADKLTNEQTSLRKTLGYGWSVAIVACPDEGKIILETLSSNSNKHIQWIMKENLKKNRLLLIDKTWVEKMQRNIARPFYQRL